MQSNPVIEKEAAFDNAVSMDNLLGAKAHMEPDSKQEGTLQMDTDQHPTVSMDNSREFVDDSSDIYTEDAELYERLFTVFERFCRFGIPSGQLAVSGVPLMDGSHYVKLFRDAGLLGSSGHKLLGRRATSTDCDIVFNSIRRINERKINFDQFVASVAVLATRIGANAVRLLHLLAASQGPTLAGTTTPHAPALATEQRLSPAERSTLATERSMSVIGRSVLPTARHSIGSPYKHQKAESCRQPRYSLRPPPVAEKMVC